jgi:hypothetical protein
MPTFGSTIAGCTIRFRFSSPVWSTDEAAPARHREFIDEGPRRPSLEAVRLEQGFD